MTWKDSQPRKEQRIQLYHKCPNCFLLPPSTPLDPNWRNYKFPICPKLSKNSTCTPTCQGIIAARKRAAILKEKYPTVRQVASELQKVMKCSKS